MTVRFDHEKLQVYQFAIDYAARAHDQMAAIPARYAVRDQHRRASESIAMSLADAVSRRGLQNRLAAADIALGSTLETAACLDVAVAYKFLSGADVKPAKQDLLSIARMLVGLRESWKSVCRESGAQEYNGDDRFSAQGFAHEELEAYQLSLAFVSSVEEFERGSASPGETLRALDRNATSIVLNIAEGNGRYSCTDHGRFLGLARQSAARAAALVDMCVAREVVPLELGDRGKELLMRIVAMLVRLRGAYVDE
jgi:four helix bundle protein